MSDMEWNWHGFFRGLLWGYAFFGLALTLSYFLGFLPEHEAGFGIVIGLWFGIPIMLGDVIIRGVWNHYFVSFRVFMVMWVFLCVGGALWGALRKSRMRTPAA